MKKDYEIYDWFCKQCEVEVKEEDRERAQRLVLSSLVKKITDIAMNDGLDSLLMLSKEIENGTK